MTLKVDFRLQGKTYTVSFYDGFRVGGDLTAYEFWTSKTKPGRKFSQKLDRLVSQGVTVNAFENRWDGKRCRSKVDAKKEYFLDVNDLSGVFYLSEHPRFFGAGQGARFYRCETLEKLAVNKHGSELLDAKRAQRKKREAEDRRKSIEADENLEEMEEAMHRLSLNCLDREPKTLQKIRGQVRKQLKPYLTHQHIHSSSGSKAVIQVPRVKQHEFAALIGRPLDPNLATSAKRGAWHSEEVPFSTFFNSEDPILGTGRNCMVGIDQYENLTVKFRPSDETLSVSLYVQYVW